VGSLAVGREGAAPPDDDLLVVEEPLEVRVHQRPWLVTLRTPGDDGDLVYGLLRSEGVIESASEVIALKLSAVPEGTRCEVTLSEVALDRWARRRLQREFTMVGGCGVCGKPTLEDLDFERPRALTSERRAALRRLSHDWVRRLPGRLTAAQKLFSSTGGLHAAALFEAGGDLLLLREDIGRHNAVDKVVGADLRENAPQLDRAPPARVLAVSGRAGFELVHKALCAEFDALVAVGAASTLAVELAERFGLGLFWFVRPEGGRCLEEGKSD
jgi:FdhD protein